LRGCSVDTLVERDDPKWHDGIYLPSFMKIDTGIQTVLTYGLRNVNGSNIGITDGRDV
jgi:hypothetical protein